MAQNSGKLPGAHLEGLCNGVVRPIVASGLRGGDLMVALAGSQVLPREQDAGRGCLTLERQRRVRLEGVWQVVKLVEHLCGWKVLVLSEVRMRLPLALAIDTIAADAGAYLVPRVEQAQANLSGHARITKSLP